MTSSSNSTSNTSTSSSSSSRPRLLCNKYIILKKLGSGSFGEVYNAEKKNSKRIVAVKVEDRNKRSRVEDEYNTYMYLHSKGFKIGLPQVYDLIKTPDYNMMFMELLGSSLDDLYDKYKKFNLETVFKLSVQLVGLMENLHNNNFIHRDIKPSNFLIGSSSNKSQIYIVDLGLSKKYRKKNKHIDLVEGRSLIGTARYASRNMHMGNEPSRRDDLESIGYMLVYFLKGKLPWQGLKKNKHKGKKMSEIGEVKISTPLDKLCYDLPDCFYQYLKYCRGLKFAEDPDYGFLKHLFLDYAKKFNINLAYMWE